MGMDLLIDADILACQFAYAYEARRGQAARARLPRDGGIDGEVRNERLRTDGRWAIAGFDSAVERMLRETRTDKAILCFTGCDNFRYAVLPTYKPNRRGAPSPVLLDVLIENARQVWECRSE